jgi:hypothetical protein
MTTAHLATLRQNAPRLTPAQFVTANPGSWVQYYDDTPAKDPAKALSVRRFDPLEAGHKQREGCAVCFSLQPFGESRTKEQLLCYCKLGVDVDLVPSAEQGAISNEEIDRRKDEYLRICLFRFPLTPHWLTETGHGFHIIFRVLPQRSPEGIREAQAINLRLVQALHGDLNAVLLTQLLRVPGTYQYKDPALPFLCRLLIDNAGAIPPYPLTRVGECLADREALSIAERSPRSAPGEDWRRPLWAEGVAGVPEGQRNATAASLAGKIVGRLPEELWEIAGWGGLKQWNARNAVPLPERELRVVFESIARRESGKRQRPRSSGEVGSASLHTAC